MTRIELVALDLGVSVYYADAAIPGAPRAWPFVRTDIDHRPALVPAWDGVIPTTIAQRIVSVRCVVGGSPMAVCFISTTPMTQLRSFQRTALAALSAARQRLADEVRRASNRLLNWEYVLNVWDTALPELRERPVVGTMPARRLTLPTTEAVSDGSA